MSLPTSNESGSVIRLALQGRVVRVRLSELRLVRLELVNENFRACEKEEDEEEEEGSIQDKKQSARSMMIIVAAAVGRSLVEL
uniref:Uncharacterized protein MANES_09G127400 n=1 Tax=Rhizophora mucronata TaxID=61149 RepID=A0A2P2L6W1_RHIMU